MWKNRYGTTNHLEDDGRDTSYISIDFGHSKDKRNDKKQIKVGLGTANGIVADAKVISGNVDEKMLKEYKTQSQVEKRFRNLKCPQYMNSLFLKFPQRVEALVYLLLIVLMILTIAEKVVRKNLKKTKDLVIGIDRRKLKRPTLDSILRIINRVRVVSYKTENGNIRRQIQVLDDSCQKIIKFLGISENYFAWNSKESPI